MPEDNAPHPCPIGWCEHTVEGVRVQPDADLGPRIAQVLGVPGAFFGDQWMFEEAQRIEKELQVHLEAHPVIDFVKEIVTLRNNLDTTLKALERCQATPCRRLCCNSQS